MSKPMKYGKPPITLSYLHDEETRVTDYATGGQKGKKLTQIGALDPVALIELGRIAGMGANKYAMFNYLKGFDWDLWYNAMQRHAALFWAGEDRDAESGLPHIAHAAWMALCGLSFYLRGIGTDTRPPRLEENEKTLRLLQSWDRMAAVGIQVPTSVKFEALGIEDADGPIYEFKNTGVRVFEDTLPLAPLDTGDEHP